MSSYRGGFVIKWSRYKLRFVYVRVFRDFKRSCGFVGSVGRFCSRKEFLDLVLSCGFISFVEYGFGRGFLLFLVLVYLFKMRIMRFILYGCFVVK